MYKFYKNWKLVFLFTLLILFLLYFGVVCKAELELPSNEWSRALSISKFKVEKIHDLMSNNIFPIPIPYNNSFITLWYEDNTIKYSITDINGTVALKNKLSLSVKPVKKIRGLLNDDIISLYILEDKKLKKYDFNFKTKQIISSRTIAHTIKDFIVHEDLLIYSDYNSLNLMDKTNYVKRINDMDVDRFEAIKDTNAPLYHIALYEKTKTGENFLNYITYDLNSKNLSKYKLTSIASSVKQSLERVDIGIVNDEINILASVIDNRFGNSSLYNFKFKKNNISSLSKNILNIKASNPFPKILKSKKDELTFLASVNITKGKDTETVNIIKYTINQNNNIKSKKLLTKTNSISLNPYYFNLHDNDYLVWTDINGKNKNIFLSSNNNNIIAATKKIKISEIFDIFMSTTTSLIPSIFMSLISIMNIFVPIILFIFLVSVIKIQLIESYSTNMFIIIFILHSILKIIYSNKLFLNNHDLHIFLPIFLKNPLFLYSLLILLTLISLYCLKIFLENSNYKRHLVKTYCFFAFIDLSIYTFLTIPYIYSYLLFTYKISIN
ncbi:hypothetical protein [Paramaledivibacter caminithermalis]|uniref:Uncharacterized protein n=1 Tax=Paramaledivibacter caminithermalis (strain DSM 15212 / CIP 107654 / DViRD3) TaxID=1121301 RepID=A0A1M6NXH1_PARC5|nr:hypothetical protein [Paramaledivibacter caminithermalis]SHK00425.1 hypothetical protein SAMN02745912_01915 [Paramaledivibacter caminithermalis DSM 15212]